MRLVSEHRSAGRRDTERVVRLYTGGIREVIQGDSEWWSRYIIIPRRLMLNEIRKLRAKGCQIVGSWNFWKLLPEGASEMIEMEHYSDPGASFTRAPHKLRSRNRQFVIIYQSGGLDI